MNDNYYPPISASKTAVGGKCPRCGRGKLFAGYLAVAKSCSSCELSYDFADAGDGATWFVMLFACVFGVGSILGIEIAYSPAWYVHVMIAIPVLIILPMIMLRPAKGFMINQQWKYNAQEGRL